MILKNKRLVCVCRILIKTPSDLLIGTIDLQPVREAVSYRGLFTAGWFDVREKYCFRLKIYDRLRASEQARNLAADLA